MILVSYYYLIYSWEETILQNHRRVSPTLAHGRNGFILQLSLRFYKIYNYWVISTIQKNVIVRHPMRVKLFNFNQKQLNTSDYT